MKGKAILYDGSVEGTRVSIYSLKKNNDYSSADGSNVYYLAALVNFSKVSSAGGVDFLSFDGNYTSTTARARVAAKKNADGGYHLGMEYTDTPTENGTTWSGVLAYNETHLIIVKIKPNTDKNTDNIESAELFLDPDLSKTEAENAASKIVSVTGKGLGSVRGINIVQKKNITGKVASLRFGTSWEDVAVMETAVDKIATKFDDGTWGDISGEAYTSGSYPVVKLNGLELNAAGMQIGSKTYETNGTSLKNRISVDNANRKGMVTLPTVSNISRINVYATPGGDNRDIKLQMCTLGTNEWIDVATYTCATKNECYFFSTVLNRTTPTKLRLVNTATGGVYIWKIETFQVVDLASVSTNFNDGSWGEASTSYSTENYPSSIKNGFELSSAGLQTGSIDYYRTYERFTQRISVDKGTNGGMLTLPAVTSLAQIDIYASSGSPDRKITLQKYNYSQDAWEDIETFTMVETTCYRFSKTLNSDEPTRLRIVNADGSTKYIWKIITYSVAPMQMAKPISPEAVNVSATSFTARWSVVSGASGYRIVLFDSNDARLKTIIAEGGNVYQYNFTDLSAETSYSFKVATIGNGQTTIDSDLSEAIAVTTTSSEVGDIYTRSVTNGNYGTICLPKASGDLSAAGAVFFEVAGKVMNGSSLKEVVLDEVDALEAGKPYVFLASASELNIPLTGEAETDPSSSNGLFGSFKVEKVSSSVYNFILSNNKLYCTKDQNYFVGEYRAYFRIEGMSEFGGGAPAPGRRRVFMGTEESQTATGLEEVMTSPKAAKQLIDGKMVIIRNGEMYDLTGKRVL